ncbi:MAG: hypothetical protein ACOYOF_08340 [Verrucomicrobiaceae bacterium]
MVHKINAVLTGLLAFLYLPTSEGFWNQLRTYFWEPATAVVVWHDLQMSPSERGPQGKIRLHIDGLPPSEKYSDSLDEKFFFNTPENTREFISRHAPGTKHQVYLSSDHRQASFGHFPREYEFRVFVNSSGYLLLCVFFSSAWRKAHLKKREAREQAPLWKDNCPLPLTIQSKALEAQHRRERLKVIDEERPFPSNEHATVATLFRCYPRMMADASHTKTCAECTEISKLLAEPQVRSALRDYYRQTPW